MEPIILKAHNRDELDKKIRRIVSLEENEEYKITVLKEPKKILFFNIQGEYKIEFIKKEEKKPERPSRPYEVRTGTENRNERPKNERNRHEGKDFSKDKFRNETRNEQGIRERKPKNSKRPGSYNNGDTPYTKPPRNDYVKKEETGRIQPYESAQAGKENVETTGPDIDKIRGFMKEFIVNSKLDLKIVGIARKGDRYTVNVDGKDIRYMIGEKGSSLTAIEYLISSVKELKHMKIVLDSNNYKEKREEALRDLARKKGKKVFDSGRNIKLNPMSARERKIIHEEISFMKGLKTESVGEEPKRYLIIKRTRD